MASITASGASMAAQGFLVDLNKPLVFQVKLHNLYIIFGNVKHVFWGRIAVLVLG
jgi:hypothetical protein